MTMTTRARPALRVAATLLSALAAHGAQAAGANAPLAVSADVQASCSVTPTPIAFGAYTGAAAAAVSTISVVCTVSTPFNIGLSQGAAAAATVATRKLTGPAAATLAYGMYADAAHRTNWGQTVGTDTLAGVGAGAAQVINIYALLPAQQYATPGAYADTVTVTVSY